MSANRYFSFHVMRAHLASTFYRTWTSCSPKKKQKKGQRPLFEPNLRLQILSKPQFDTWRRPPTFGVVEPMKGFTTICGAPQYLSIKDKQK